MGGGQPHDDEPGAIGDGTPRDPTVLVVDDEPAVRAAIVRSLQMAGIDAIAAADGRRALRLVADGHLRPTVLLTDMEMPQMGGVELVARMHALRPAMRIVMMTGDPARADRARQRSSIVLAVLLKPIVDADLVAAVRAAPEPVTR